MTLWVLGAGDPEMEHIEQVLREHGQNYAYAVDGLGKRVTSANMYSASGCDEHPDYSYYAKVVFVECCYIQSLATSVAMVATTVHIDHHRPGDAGYGRPPSEFLPASSIGQVLSLLAEWWGLNYDPLPGEAPKHPPGTIFGTGEWRVTSKTGVHPVPEEVLLVAAADHCLAAAYRGECPGVEPERLMRWRAESRAAFQKRSVENVLADIEKARAILKERFDGTLADLRGIGTIPELPEAAARDGVPFLAVVKERDGREKVVLQAADKELAGRFMSGEIVSGLSGVYGDPARGFAGGYVS